MWMVQMHAGQRKANCFRTSDVYDVGGSFLENIIILLIKIANGVP